MRITPCRFLTALTLFAIAGCGAVDEAASPGELAAATHAMRASAAVSGGVDLAAVANVTAIAATGAAVQNGGMDTYGYAYAANLTGSSVSWGGTAFALGAPGVADAVHGGTVALPPGSHGPIKLLGAAVQGNHVNQVFTVQYADGSADTFKQSMSDWNTPQNYAGESSVLTLPYKVRPTGAILNQVNRLYGYTLATNAAKTVVGIGLPANRDIVILAITVVSSTAPPTAAAPTFTPAPGTYASAQTVALSDTTPGAVIHYTVDGTAPTSASPTYAAPLAVPASATLEAMAVAPGYLNSGIAVATYTIQGGSGPVVDLNLSPNANVYAIAIAGVPIPAGGLDTYGYAYAASLLGSSLTWSGTPFTLGRAGVPDGLHGGTLAVPAGRYSSVKILGTAVQGSHVNQVFTVTYSDGSSDSFRQSMSDWSSPQNYAGEARVLTLPYKLRPQGTTLAQLNYLYGYVFPVNGMKTVVGITLPNNRDIVVLAIALVAAQPTSTCDPLAFGAVGDGTTDNTSVIQGAIDACAAQGGGTVEFKAVGGRNVYLTGPVALKSHVQLQIDQGVTLQATNDHSRFVGAYINWVYQPREALISAASASYVGISGAGTIDGAGDQLQPGGGPSWWTLAAGQPTSVRPWLLEFYQCDHVTITGVTLRNAPMWNQALRFSDTITESGVTVTAPPTSPNTDGVDVVGSTNVVLSNLDISVGDDNIALKSGLPIDPKDPKQAGLPQRASSQIQISNVTAGSGHGLSIGSEAYNGVNSVAVRGVHLTYTGNGIRIKSARDRGGQLHHISFADIVMTDVALPIILTDYYPAVGGPSEPPYQAAQPISRSTPYVHDITIQNVTATGATQQSVIEGLPESCMHDVNLTDVSIKTSAAGMVLRHMTGSFDNVVSTPGSGPSFVVQENVTVAAAGTTPAINATAPMAGQTACGAQVVPAP